MNKNTLIGIGLVVAILTAWLVVAVAVKTNETASDNTNESLKVEQPKDSAAQTSTPKDTTTNGQTTATVDIVSDNVTSTVEVK